VSIRLKLSLAFALFALGALVPTILITYTAVRHAATNKVSEDVGQTLQEFNRQVEGMRVVTQERIQGSLMRAELIKDLVRGNAQDASYGLGEESDDRGELKIAHDLLYSAELSLLKGNSEALLIVNARGEVLYNEAARPEFGAKVTNLPVLDAALHGRPASDLWSPAFIQKLPFPLLTAKASTNDLFLMISQPLVANGNQLFGAVLVGHSIRAAVLPELERLAHGKIALEAMDGQLGGGDDAVSAATEFQEGKEADFQMHGVEYLGAARPLTQDGRALGKAVLLRALAPEIAPVMKDFWARLGPEALAFLLLSFIAIQLAAKRLSSPLVQLEAAAREVEHGNLDVRVEPKTRDEVGRLATTFNQMVQGLKQRDEIKGLFKRYLNPQVVEELIRHPERASPGGERRELTLLFADLVGFTSNSERMSPEALVSLLNRYFEEATQVLAHRGATLDKFIGDAIMCFWNAPLLQAEHARLSCLAALDLMAVIDRLAPEFEQRGFNKFGCRIGINTGPAVVGNLGSSQAQDYTAVGDAVNLASRLEGACKYYGTRSLISEGTYEHAREVVVARELDLVRVVGRAVPTRVYALVGPAGTPLDEDARRFAHGLELYRARRFEDALEQFHASPGDPPSRLYVERCRKWLASPPPADWDGAHTLIEK
jgi:adenylate cyclase